MDGAGKTTFADDLVVSLPRGVAARTRPGGGPDRSRRRPAPRGSPVPPRPARPRGVLDSLDLDAFRAAVPEPPGEVDVLVDGLFRQRDEQAGNFDLVVFLDVPFAVTAARMAVRDGTPGDPDHPRPRRYVEGQRIYVRRGHPPERADLVVEHSDPLAATLAASQQRRLPS